MIDRVQIKAKARAVLSANYWNVMAAIGIMAGISLVCEIIPGINYIATALVIPVLTVGIMNYMLRMTRGENPDIVTVFDGFKNYAHVLGGYWWMMLWVFLWSLLFYIPGIIKGLSYSMTQFILLDEPELGAKEALEKSKAMMEGHKAELFVLYLSFIGWALLSVFTCGILSIFFVSPYLMLAYAIFYDSLKNGYVSTGYTPATDNTYGATYTQTANVDAFSSEPVEEIVTEKEVEDFIDPLAKIVEDYDATEGNEDK